MPEPVRRSARSRTATTKSKNADWGKEVLRLLRESSESSNPTSVDSKDEPTENDREFQHQRSPTDGGPGDDGDNQSMISVSSGPSRGATPREDGEKEVQHKPTIEDRAGRDKSRSAFKSPVHLRSRGITIVERGKSARSGAWQAMFGPEVTDLKPMLLARDRWLYHIRDVTLPSNATMEEARSNEWSEHVEGPTSDNPDGHLSTPIRKMSKLKSISFDEAKGRHFVVEGRAHRILLGPWSQQEVYQLPFLEPVSIGQAWKMDKDSSGPSYHSGWVVNVGEKPLCVAWSGHQRQAQYLALTCRSTPSQRESVPKVNSESSPAFSSSAPYPSSVQIWEFQTVLDQHKQIKLDCLRPPRLVEILACSCGDIKQMEWAPQPLKTINQESRKHLGLLTLITTDGCLRLVHVPQPDSLSSEPACLEVQSPTLRIEPPQSMIFTCFAFASPTDLILGTSSGHVCLYNISQAQSSSDNPKPYLQLQLHHTYIISLCTLPDEYSHFIATLSAVGTIQLTDLRSSSQDAVSVPRARLPTRNLIFNPHARAFIVTNDSSGNTEARGTAQTTLTAHTFRHFFSSMALARFPGGRGTATALAGSPLHPCILMGNSSGTVWSQNVVRRILPTGKPSSAQGKDSGAGAWVQKVIEYEWVPEVADAADAAASNDQGSSNETPQPDFYHGPPVRPGTSRMHHGFRPEKVDLSHTAGTANRGGGQKKNKTTKKRKHNNTTATVEDDDDDNDDDDGDGTAGGGVNSTTTLPASTAAAQVIFEEEQAVTALAWNPDPAAAGWCAVAWASGVVCVTDLGHDAV